MKVYFFQHIKEGYVEIAVSEYPSKVEKLRRSNQFREISAEEAKRLGDEHERRYNETHGEP